MENKVMTHELILESHQSILKVSESTDRVDTHLMIVMKCR